jgi:hypothetical protein
MTEAVRRSLSVLKQGEYRNRRIDNDFNMEEALREVPLGLANTVMMEAMLRKETPFLLEGDRFGFNRTLKNLPYVPVLRKGRIKKKNLTGIKLQTM